MAIEVIEFFESSDQEKWIEQIGAQEPEACKYLSNLLKENKLKNLCGQSTKLLMLTENKKLYSFCTLAEQDEVNAPYMTPWIGFVYTIPEQRNHNFAATLVEIACEKAEEMGASEVFVSPPDIEQNFYEKLGFSRYEYPMSSIYGYETYVYRKSL